MYQISISPQDFLHGKISKKFLDKIVAEVQRYGQDKILIEISIKHIQEQHFLENPKI